MLPVRAEESCPVGHGLRNKVYMSLKARHRIMIAVAAVGLMTV